MKHGWAHLSEPAFIDSENQRAPQAVLDVIKKASLKTNKKIIMKQDGFKDTKISHFSVTLTTQMIHSILRTPDKPTMGNAASFLG
ncbi:hypothetical protein CEXT_137861 [Caerostris extrusa]|uniref:Uncharacterized protein n=1 Tax=Caerostris extrusa TaxID=172846 RepID=A0AAV4RDQ0_CAEEX|nr:hypothetical protein CEXT_137861 [Caerostris extrusa]